MFNRLNPKIREELHELLCELGWDSVVLLVSNLSIIVLALVNGWEFFPLLWVYWWQNNVIGLFTWLRMRRLKNFSSGGWKEDGRLITPTEASKKRISWFFLLHFGFFQLVYFAFLFPSVYAMSSEVFLSTCIGITIFILNHAFSFKYNLKKDLNTTPNIGTISVLPYLRILPMQLILFIWLLLDGGSKITLLLFLLLKTFADLLMHVVQHVDWSGSPAPLDVSGQQRLTLKQRIKRWLLFAWVTGLLFVLFGIFVFTEIKG